MEIHDSNNRGNIMSKRQIKPSVEMSSFGILLTSYLSKHGMSIAEFCRRLGCYETTVRNWIDGKSFPNMEHVIIIAEMLSRLECCFGDTMIQEIASTHPIYTNMIRRESKRFQQPNHPEGIDAGVV